MSPDSPGTEGWSVRVVRSLASGQHVVAMGSQYHASVDGLQLNPHAIEEFPILQAVGSQL